MAVMCLSEIVFALGETLWAPVAPALVNDLAAEHFRGRDSALAGLVWGLGHSGPLIAMLLVADGHGVVAPLPRVKIT